MSGNENWQTIATLAQGSDANTWSGTIDASSWTSGAKLSFKLYDSKDDNKEYYWGNSGTADMTTNSSVTLSDANTSESNMTLKHNTAYSSYTLNCSYSEAGWTITITGVKSSTGGGTSTTPVNQPGIYLYGSDFGATSSTDRLHYKFVRKNDSEYHFALYAGYMQYSANQYGGNNTNITPSWNYKSFTIAYIDADGKFSTFCPSGNYALTGSDDNAANAKSFGSNTQWTIQNNGGMYDLVVKVDADGKPTSWHYESDANKVVAYKASSTSNWTTEGFLYCVKDANSDAKAYCQNFFGTTPMVQDEEFKFILGNYWFGKRDDNDPYDLNVSIANDSKDAPNLKSPYDGIYPIEFNPSRTDYQLAGGDKTPLRIFMIGSALNSSLGDDFTKWNPADATELVYDPNEQCYKGTVTLAKKGQFRFLRDIHSSGPATSLELNFGEDGHKPGEGGDTDFNNYVAYNSTSNIGTNVVFNPETNIYNVRFYIEAGTGMSNFNWNDAKYRYTIELPTRLNATITPTTATVNYAASLTPKVGVVGTNAPKRKYAFTIDGSDPTIDATTGEGTGNTVVRDYTYDTVVPTNDVYTFYMSATDQLTYLDVDGTEHTLEGNTVTVKAQAVQTINEGSKYRLEGNIATGTYTFKTAGIKPAGSYTISVTNENQTDKPSINKVTATVTVKNKDGKDDGVDVFYTIDGTDPVAVGNVNARLVNKDRKINVYGIVNLVHGAKNYIRVAIAGSPTMNGDDGKTHASCEYDLTCSTSEGGYINYRDGYTNPSLKTYGGDGHIVVYILPWSSNQTTYAQKPTNPTPKSVENCTNFRVPFIYAYENIDKDGVVESKALTHATHTIDVLLDEVFGLPTIEKGGSKCYWSYVDLVPDNDDKEVNIEMGYYDMITNELKLTPATIANVHNDMFLEFDVATGQIKDVTHKYTKDHFYTIGEGGTKLEPANPTAKEHFFYAQVPEAWTINGNSVKVLQNDTELSGYTVKVQGSAETSCLSKVCKISVPATLDEGTSLTIQPYNGKNGSSQKLTVNYVNGGYYFYESASHYTTNAPLVFGADADDDKDQRPKGRRDVNHTLETQPAKRVAGTGYMGYGDYTYYLTPNWTYSGTTQTPTTTETDNWNGKQATVNTIAKGTTISQTVEELPDGLYTVQMIVRGADKATATLQLVGSDYTVKGEKKGNSSASVNKTFAGYDAQGTVTTDGRVEYLLKTDTKNGWQKLETVASVGSEGKLTISLKAEGGELQLSDVTLLRNANTPPDVLGVDEDGKPIYYYRPTIWTTAPTGKDVTEYDLTARQSANAFSFFDRGDNRNAVIYADKNTVLGMSENTYNVAVPIYDDSEESPAKHGTVFRSSGSNPGKSEPDYWEGKALVWEDEPDAWVNNNSWGTTVYTIWNGFRWNRKFTGTSTGSGERNTIFLPFAMSNDQITAIFGTDAKIYSIESVDAPNLKVTGTPATRNDDETGESVTGTESNVPYILELPNAKDGVSYDGELDTEPSKYENYSNATTIGNEDHPQGEFVGVYQYTNITSKSDGTYDYYGYDAEDNGRFNFFSDEGADFKPFRAYLKIKTSAGSKPFYYFVVDEGGTTGIDGVSATTLSDDAPVYNLQGQLVRQAGQHTQLPKGLYIQKGRKFVQQ
ncbi:MAG: hypothetical protein SPM31_05645 [Prevotella sp.]|nr:hypothetical protein [Prevotella sp.]